MKSLNNGLAGATRAAANRIAVLAAVSLLGADLAGTAAFAADNDSLLVRNATVYTMTRDSTAPLQGTDVLDDAEAVRRVAAALPGTGVTAFCPTSVACEPATLQRMLEAVRQARQAPAPGAARVLPAHLESNFINPAWNGAQPAGCLRWPPSPEAEASAQPGD